MLLNRMGAKRKIAPGFRQREPMPGFEPLPVFIDQRKKRHGHPTNMSSSLGQLIEDFFLGRIQEVVGSKSGNALNLLRRVGRI
jgi:hypothetical protein